MIQEQIEFRSTFKINADHCSNTGIVALKLTRDLGARTCLSCCCAVVRNKPVTKTVICKSEFVLFYLMNISI
jgi:hypothetical protein